MSENRLLPDPHGGVHEESLRKVAEDLKKMVAVDPVEEGGCVLCDTGHKPIRIVQMKGRLYRPIPPSKNRSARILKKLKKRQELQQKAHIFTFNKETLDLRFKEMLRDKKPIFEGIVDESSSLKKYR